MKYCESELIEKKKECNQILIFIKRFKRIFWKKKELAINEEPIYTFNKKDVNLLCKYFEEERLNKLQEELQQLKEECVE